MFADALFPIFILGLFAIAYGLVPLRFVEFASGIPDFDSMTLLFLGLAAILLSSGMLLAIRDLRREKKWARLYLYGVGLLAVLMAIDNFVISSASDSTTRILQNPYKFLAYPVVYWTAVYFFIKCRRPNNMV
jgi:ABC-type Fe3+-siderophore transport system permease subunit